MQFTYFYNIIIINSKNKDNYFCINYRANKNAAIKSIKSLNYAFLLILNIILFMIN